VGDAVLFYSTDPNLALDPHALHGACPVVRGVKVSMAKWLHNTQVGMPRHMQQTRAVTAAAARRALP
jgi:hypothetical protein